MPIAEAVTPPTAVPSKLCREIYSEYLNVFNQLWGLTSDDCTRVGACRRLFPAEFMEQGPAAYATSIISPLRNAFYSCYVTDGRWEKKFSKLDMQQPILDYGCGVGFLLVYLKRMGFDDLYGYEVPGPQHRVMAEMFKYNGIRIWGGERMRTVVCSHVLEHVEDPENLLDKLRNIGDCLYANCDDSSDPCHIASNEVRKRVNDSLRERDEWLGES